MPAESHVGHCHSAVFSAAYVHSHAELSSAPYGHYHSAVCNALYIPCHSVVFSAPFGHCHSEGCSTLYGVTMQCLVFLIVTVTLKCSVPLACAQASEVLFSQSKIIAKFSQSAHCLHWHLCTPVNTYITLYNVPL